MNIVLEFQVFYKKLLKLVNILIQLFPLGPEEEEPLFKEGKDAFEGSFYNKVKYKQNYIYLADCHS